MTPTLVALILDTLFPGDGLLDPLAGTGIRLGPLSAAWQAATMTQAPVARDRLQTTDVIQNLTTQLAFDCVVVVQCHVDPLNVVFRQLASPPLRVKLQVTHSCIAVN